MSKYIFAITLWLIPLTMLMPPGLCGCWLSANPVQYHFHLGFPEPEHNHDYLNQLSLASGGVVLSILIPADVFVTLAAIGGLFRKMHVAVFQPGEWLPFLDSPPPRG